MSLHIHQQEEEKEAVLDEELPMKTFVLIRLKNAKHPSWWERQGGILRNVNGGYFSFPEEECRILKAVAAEGFDGLDWSETKLGKVEGYSNGWLSPSGDWYSCYPEDCENVAQFILKKSPEMLRGQGWCKVLGGEVFSGYQPGTEKECCSVEQRAFFEKHGIRLKNVVCGR